MSTNQTSDQSIQTDEILQKNEMDLSEQNRRSDDEQTTTTGNDTVFNNCVKILSI